MKLRKTNTFIFLLCKCLIGVAQPNTTCYEDFKESLSFECIENLHHIVAENGLIIESPDSFFYKNIPNVIKVAKTKNCLNSDGGKIYSTKIQDVLVVVPESLNDFNITLDSNVITFPVRLVPQVKVLLYFFNTIVSDVDSISVKKIKDYSHAFSLKFGADMKLNKCLSNLYEKRYELLNVNLSQFRDEHFLFKVQGTNLNYVIGQIKDMKKGDFIILQFNIGINDLKGNAMYSEIKFHRINII